MFTGIVTEVGTVRAAEATPSGRRLDIDGSAVAGRLALGDSVLVAGACLTVTKLRPGGFSVDLVPETLARTTLGAAHAGSRVDLEPAATPETALGGHIVQGHVDGTTALLSRTPIGEGARLRFALPPELARWVVEKGYVALDGVSLTIASLEPDAFEIALIPHTATHTTLGTLAPGERVNVEADIIGKYVERLLAHPPIG